MSRLSKGKRAKKSFFIITEGETEERYFSEFKQKQRCSGITIKRVNPCSRQIISKAKSVWRNEGFSLSNYNKQVIVIDKDALTEDDFHAILRQAVDSKIEVVFSNSAFEVWLLAHFEPITRGFLSANELKRRLSNHLTSEYKKGDIRQLRAIVKHFTQAFENTRNVSSISYDTQCTNVGDLCQRMIED